MTTTSPDVPRVGPGEREFPRESEHRSSREKIEGDEDREDPREREGERDHSLEIEKPRERIVHEETGDRVHEQEIVVDPVEYPGRRAGGIGGADRPDPVRRSARGLAVIVFFRSCIASVYRRAAPRTRRKAFDDQARHLRSRQHAHRFRPHEGGLDRGRHPGDDRRGAPRSAGPDSRGDTEDLRGGGDRVPEGVQQAPREPHRRGRLQDSRRGNRRLPARARSGARSLSARQDDAHPAPRQGAQARRHLGRSRGRRRGSGSAISSSTTCSTW